MRLVPPVVLAAALLLAGCGDRAPRPVSPALPPPPPAVPCLSQSDDTLFTTCLRTELDEVWRREFQSIGRTYTTPALSVGEPPSPATEHAQQLTRERAYYNPRTGIHFPTQYLDDVYAAHRYRAHLVLTFTMGHETGHHVQHLLHAGTKAPLMQVELQADCYAGVWARQEAATGRLDPEQFRPAAEAELRRLSTDADEVGSHGTAAQRIASLGEGLRTGDPAACDVGKLTWR